MQIACISVLLVHYTNYTCYASWKAQAAMEMSYMPGYVTTRYLVNWAMVKNNIHKPREKLTGHDIAKIMRWVGLCSVDTIYIGAGKPVIGRIGIGLMLTVTLLEFPEYYAKHELAQFN